MTKTYHRYFPALSLLVFVLFVAGCGGGNALKTYRVEGTVTHNGQPVADASITFYPASGDHAGYAKTNADGKYQLSTHGGAAETGTVPGEYTVTISKKASEPTGRTLTSTDDDGNPISYPETTMKETLPTQYTSVQTTPFKAVVEAKKTNVFDFALE